VADEVRKLAEQATSATREIDNLIKAIQAEASRAVESAMEGSQIAAAVEQAAMDVSTRFKKIIIAVENAAIQCREIATSTEQMSSGFQNVAAAAEEQTAAMEEVSASAETLAEMAENLNNLVGKFKVK